MIKLTDLINELDKPENIYAPGYSPEEEDKKFLKKGYRMVGTTVDPETGKSSSNVEQIARFDKISNEISDMMTQIRPLKRLIASEKDELMKQIKAKSTEAVSLLRQAQIAVNDLKGLIELYK